MVLDSERILPNQVPLEHLHDLVDGTGVAPAGGLAGPNQPGISGDPHELPAADDQRLDLGDLHGLYLRWCFRSTARRQASMTRRWLQPARAPPTACRSSPGCCRGVGALGGEDLGDVRRLQDRTVLVEEARCDTMLIRPVEGWLVPPAAVHHVRTARCEGAAGTDARRRTVKLRQILAGPAPPPVWDRDRRDQQLRVRVLR